MYAYLRTYVSSNELKFIDVIYAKWQLRRFADWIGPKPVTELYGLCILRASMRNRNYRFTYRRYISKITCVRFRFPLFSLFFFFFILKLNYLSFVDGILLKRIQVITNLFDVYVSLHFSLLNLHFYIRRYVRIWIDPVLWFHSYK